MSPVLKIVLINIGLFLLFFIIYLASSFTLSAFNVAGYWILASIIYAFIAILHLVINFLLVKKQPFLNKKPLLVSTIIIVVLYCINLISFR